MSGVCFYGRKWMTLTCEKNIQIYGIPWLFHDLFIIMHFPWLFQAWKNIFKIPWLFQVFHDHGNPVISRSVNLVDQYTLNLNSRGGNVDGEIPCNLHFWNQQSVIRCKGPMGEPFNMYHAITLTSTCILTFA